MNNPAPAFYDKNLKTLQRCEVFLCKKEFVDRVVEHKLTGLGFRDPRIHELSSISGNVENPVPEVEKFKLKK